MRITNQMLNDTVMRNLAQNIRRMEKYQAQISSGKRINSLSDDPVALVRSLTLRSAMEQNDQFSRSIDAAKSWLSTTDVNLGANVDLLIKARELAVRGANDVLGRDQRHAIALEVRQLIENSIQVGNATYQGRFIFGGFRTDATPFTLAADALSFTYNGDHGVILREIGVDTSVSVNTDGEVAFTPALDALMELYRQLEADDAVAVAASIDLIDDAMDTLSSARAEVGAKLNRLEASSLQISEVQIFLADLLSKAEDTDMAEAITRLATEETVYRAALGAAGRIIQPSLLDFLR